MDETTTIKFRWKTSRHSVLFEFSLNLTRRIPLRGRRWSRVRSRVGFFLFGSIAVTKCSCWTVCQTAAETYLYKNVFIRKGRGQMKRPLLTNFPDVHSSFLSLSQYLINKKAGNGLFKCATSSELRRRKHLKPGCVQRRGRTDKPDDVQFSRMEDSDEPKILSDKKVKTGKETGGFCSCFHFFVSETTRCVKDTHFLSRRAELPASASSSDTPPTLSPGHSVLKRS